MKKLLVIIAFIVACVFSVKAQVSSKQIIFVASDPSVCNSGRQYNNYTSGDIFERLGTSGTTCTKIVNVSGGGVSGSGTTNTITKWTSASALGNSGITDDGTTVVIDAKATLSVGNTTSAVTDLLVNPTTKASGNLIDLQVNGVSRFSVTSAGIGAFLSTLSSSGAIRAGDGQFNGFATRGGFIAASNGVIRVSNNNDDDFTRFQFGGTTSSFPALGRSTTVLSARLADGAAGGTFDATGSLSNTGITTDAGHTDATVCVDTTSKVFYFGSGTIGICLGTSGAKFKQNMLPLDVGLNQIMDLRPISFNYKATTGYDPNKTYYGFTAESVAPVMPELAPKDASGAPQSVDLVGMIPVLVRAVQEQQAEIISLKEQLETLRGRLKDN